MSNNLESLPVELIADILGELDLSSLIVVSHLSHRLRSIVSEPSLNPWRRPILLNLRSPNKTYEPCLKNLAVRTTVPRQNWVEILSLARAEFLLFEATMPTLKESEWEESFKRRFLPGWTKWKKEDTWKAAFLKLLHRVWHRCHSSCTSDEAWTRYILLNRNGTANLLDGMSRNYNPLTVFHETKLQNNMAHLETHVRLVVEFADVRVIALGVLNTKTSFTVNANARLFLHPPGVEKAEHEDIANGGGSGSGEDAFTHHPDLIVHRSAAERYHSHQAYRPVIYPLPAVGHANYPLHTPSGEDKRWLGTGDYEEAGMTWIGPMMITAQLVGPRTKEPFADSPPLQDLDLVTGPGRAQYASLTWADLAVLAPWLEIVNMIDGPGLGH